MDRLKRSISRLYELLEQSSAILLSSFHELNAPVNQFIYEINNHNGLSLGGPLAESSLNVVYPKDKVFEAGAVYFGNLIVIKSIIWRLIRLFLGVDAPSLPARPRYRFFLWLSHTSFRLLVRLLHCFYSRKNNAA